MVSLLDLVISYFIYFIPSLTLTFIAVLIGFIVYLFGKKKNIQLMDTTIELFQKIEAPQSLKFNLVERSTNGRTYLVDLKEEHFLKNYRVHLTLIPRHLIISRIGAFIRKRKDYLLIEADPTDKIVNRYQIEIVPLREEKRIKNLVDMLGKLQKINMKSSQFGEILGFWVNDPEFFKAIFKNEPQILRNIFSQRYNIVRISYYPLDSPSIRLVAELSEMAEPEKLMAILFDLTKNIVTLASKGFYSKQKIKLRIIKDKTIEEEKQKGRDRRFKI